MTYFKPKAAALSAAAMLAVLAVMGGMARTAAADECTIKVGTVLPTSVDWGKPIAATTQMAIDLVNEAGGVGGCKVDNVLRDTQTDPKVGVDAAKALVDLDKVQLLIGAVSSGVSMPILTSVSVPAGVMQISCCSSSTRFTGLAQEGKTNGLWFRTFATSHVQSAIGAMLAKEGGYKKIAVFYKNDDWGQDMAKLVDSDLKALGIEVTASVAITDAQPSYRAEVAEALASQPEAIYLALYPKEGISVVREWISLGGTSKMIGANSLKSDEFRDSVGLKYLGDFVGTDTSSPRTDSANAFVDLYKSKFNAEPNGPGLANAMDATMIAMLAYQAAGAKATGAEIAAKVAMVTDPKGTPVAANADGFKQASALLAEGKSVSYQGATGAVVFDKNGDVSAPAVTWAFTESGINELKYIPLEEVDSFIASLEK